MLLQSALVLAGLGTLAFAPPAEGRMLLVPLHADQSAARVALSHGALLLGRGPLPGSVVVIGRHAALERAAWDAGMLVMAAPPAGCGTGEA